MLILSSLPEPTQRDIAAGATRASCPQCAGGAGREQSLSIRHEAAFVSLHCYRNKCGYRARVLRPGKSAGKLPRAARVYDRATIDIDGHLAAWLLARYELRPEHYAERWRQELPDGRLVMPILGPHGQTRGHMTRTLAKPKICLAYRVSQQPWLDWWLAGRVTSDSLYIVEDSISACKMYAAGHAAAALLGTELGLSKAAEIADVCDGRGLRPVLALDPDATEKAFRLQRQFAHVLPGVRVQPMAADPKDTPMATLRGFAP